MPTIVTHDGHHTPHFGKQKLLDVSGNSSFAGMVFESLSEKTPTKKELVLFELLLNLSIDHGENAPSTKATIAASSVGKNMGEAVAEGVRMVNTIHGGAQEPLMRLLYQMHEGKDPESIVSEYLKAKKRIPGFGHRLYNKDPRAGAVIQKIEQLRLSEEYISLAKKLETELYRVAKKKYPINIDGAIAIALCTMGWRPEWSQAVFIVGRSAGLSAHYIKKRG